MNDTAHSSKGTSRPEDEIRDVLSLVGTVPEPGDVDRAKSATAALDTLIRELQEAREARDKAVHAADVLEEMYLKSRELVDVLNPGLKECKAKLAQAEAQLERLREALELGRQAMERHAAWCGYNKDAPGDYIHRRFTDAAEAALSLQGEAPRRSFNEHRPNGGDDIFCFECGERWPCSASLQGEASEGEG